MWSKILNEWPTDLTTVQTLLVIEHLRQLRSTVFTLVAGKTARHFCSRRLSLRRKVTRVVFCFFRRCRGAGRKKRLVDTQPLALHPHGHQSEKVPLDHLRVVRYPELMTLLERRKNQESP